MKPTHIGFILDGNRRWAKARNLPTLSGHKAGYDRLLDLAHFAKKSGVKFVSAFVFSTENWNRSAEEVSYLMNLLLAMFSRDAKKLIREGFKVVVMKRDLPTTDAIFAKIEKKIREIEQLSAELSEADFNGTTLALCFNYGGQAEIVDATRAIAGDLAQEIRENPTLTADEISRKINEITEENFAKNLYHPEVPPCDLIVRTSGEMRISGFQLWRAAYAEFLFVDKNWPDFGEADFAEVLAEYSQRQRRFGK
jgi:undecaprenyl diphosphate synthase